MRSIIQVTLATGLAAFMACNHEGCKPVGGAELEREYQGLIAACAATSPTLKASCECRKAVDEKFGLCDHPDWPQIGRCDYPCED